jgi:hypothetical protein
VGQGPHLACLDLARHAGWPTRERLDVLAQQANAVTIQDFLYEQQNLLGSQIRRCAFFALLEG